jgi:hypothetical protein
MARKGGETAKAGFYWHGAGWEIVTLAGKGGVLPGSDAERYVRIPTLAMLLLAPVMGGVFVVFLPLIGFVLALGHLGGVGLRGARRVAARLAAGFHRARHA